MTLVERVTAILDQAGQRPVDLLVGRHRWQHRLLDRAEPAVSGGTPLPTALARDLVLLKLFAGGSQDAWDIEQLLAGPDRGTLVACGPFASAGPGIA